MKLLAAMLAALAFATAASAMCDGTGQKSDQTAERPPIVLPPEQVGS